MHIYVVDDVTFKISTRISQNDIAELKKEFGYEIYLEGASYGGNGVIKEYKYSCNHDLLIKYKHRIYGWLDDNNFPVSFTIITNSISVYAYEELSDSQIHDFEREFGVKCKEYSLSCNSNLVQYEFE